MARSRYRIFDSHYPHFLTCTIVDWLPVFTRAETCQIVLDSWRFLQDQGRLELYGFVILENHVHWIALADDLSKEVACFKSFTARRILDCLEQHRAETLLRQLRDGKALHKTGQTYQLWQEGSHPQMIQNGDMMRQKLEYIHNNPLKRGFVDEAIHWRYSSARNYDGRPGLIDVTTDW